MEFSMHRLSAIIRKEFQDAGKNSQILLMAAMPLVLAFVYSRMNMHEARTMMTSFPVVMSLVMVGSFVQAMMIAEEKEKNTLRVLMLSPASPLEVLMGKSAITFLITMIICIVSLLFFGMPKANMFVLFTVLTISAILFIAIGTIIGLLSRAVTDTSIIGLPILMVLMMGPFFEMLFDNKIVSKIVSYMPTKHIMDSIYKVLEGKSFGAMSSNLLTIAIWTVVSVIACFFIYKKRRLD
ncbi:ABC transporter permease [Microbacteriaceae bacterium 4G12]